MKAHRREAKNCALIECCQVVAEKAGVALQAASRAASSLRDGGGERGRLPARTALDQHGVVTGIDTGGYARKAGAAGRPAQQVANAGLHDAGRCQRGPSSCAVACPRSGSVDRLHPEPEPPRPAPSENRPRQGAMRFSSISGFRRR